MYNKDDIVDWGHMNVDDVSKEVVGKVYTALMKSIKELLSEGGTVRLQDIGTLTPKRKRSGNATVVFSPYESLEKTIDPYLLEEED